MFFVFNDTATTEIYTLFLHDALPIYSGGSVPPARVLELLSTLHTHSLPCLGLHYSLPQQCRAHSLSQGWAERSEEHTSELQSRQYLVCRLLLEIQLFA